MWYKAEYRSGPGHQSCDEVYFWCTEDLMANEDLRDDYWLSYIPEWAKWDHTVGEIEPVLELPEKIRKEKIKHYEWQLKNAQYMLSVVK